MMTKCFRYRLFLTFFLNRRDQLGIHLGDHAALRLDAGSKVLMLSNTPVNVLMGALLSDLL